jgi:hypothetical protein
VDASNGRLGCRSQLPCLLALNLAPYQVHRVVMNVSTNDSDLDTSAQAMDPETEPGTTGDAPL